MEVDFPSTQGKEIEVAKAEHGTIYYIGLGKAMRNPHPRWLHVYLMRNADGKLLDMEKYDTDQTIETLEDRFMKYQPPERTSDSYRFTGSPGNVTVGF